MKQKSLFIIRHAKAELPIFGKDDFDRDLLPKGTNRAELITQKLKAQLPAMDEKTLVISSTANRAMQTAKIFCDILGYPEERIVWEPKVYEAHYLFLMKLLNDVPASYDYVLLFGHNPGVSDLVGYVTDRFVNLKTAHTAYLELEEGIDYSLLSANTASLKKIITEND
ncbi:SixA phosphatase family protein [Sphingobacterium chuzhouense]|uniref:Histidine phosphatase family protein n=1 Tax=Sphingobacterium chuzhouense TaxID=1742264 RepID=A0ABR7XWW3_9SPHI|nr:histidine phosphatase family protein [Sphingobacterium chuzhouense]MBD1423523.1 histidine phosphatase family protein [Sphingobacterium chuzhouense]